MLGSMQSNRPDKGINTATVDISTLATQEIPCAAPPSPQYWSSLLGAPEAAGGRRVQPRSGRLSAFRRRNGPSYSWAKNQHFSWISEEF